MEVYHMPLQQQQQSYAANPFQDDVEKAGNIHSANSHHHYHQQQQQQQPLHPHPHSPANLAYGHGYASRPMTPATPVNYHGTVHHAPLPSHISSSVSTTMGVKKDGGRDKNVINVQARLAGCIFAMIVILFAAVIGLAAGLGMTQENLRQARSDLLLAQSKLVGPGAVNSNPPTTPQPPTTVTATVSAPTNTPETQAAIKCPAANGTFYTTSSTGDASDSSGTGRKQFQRMCGIDYGQGEAKDITSKKVASLDECLDACAARSDCTGAGWGVITGDKGTTHSCWMKKGLIKPHKATPDWGFGILVTGTEAGGNSTEGSTSNE